MVATTKQVLVFLTVDDEVAVSRGIAEIVPDVKFLDFSAWSAVDEPPVRDSVLDCGSIVSIWNPCIVPNLPATVRSDGKVMGPQIGPVLQWVRCKQSPLGELRSGRLAASYDRESLQMAAFVQQVWKVLLRKTENKLQRVQQSADGLTAIGPERRLRIGPNAESLASTGALKLLSGALRVVPEGSALLAI
jgi:hypothetical protein